MKSGNSRRPAPADEPHMASAPPVFDLDDLGARLCGRMDVVPRLTGMFRKNTADNLQALRRAIDAGDREQVRVLAHTIKGAAANISAQALRRTATELESRLREGEGDGWGAYLARLESEFAEFEVVAEQACDELLK